MLRRLCMALTLGILMTAALVPVAYAEPSESSKNVFPFTIECDGQLIDIVFIGQIGSGEVFAPAHVVGSTSVFQPLILDETIEFTPNGGTTETTTFQATKPSLGGNVQGDLVTCHFDDTKTFPDGVVHVVGTVTGVFTPKS
ncbi:MAG TPA: hypothetical protein VK390_15995 [Propionibacteriaceae bacterium]|nr:hypothetical protein [Propionibacteriaceae bacterium]